jgi:hypothetical protein
MSNQSIAILEKDVHACLSPNYFPNLLFEGSHNFKSLEKMVAKWLERLEKFAVRGSPDAL